MCISSVTIFFFLRYGDTYVVSVGDMKRFTVAASVDCEMAYSRESKVTKRLKVLRMSMVM